MRTRSRSNSSRTSTKSVKSAAAAEVEATRKTRRDLEREVKKFMEAAHQYRSQSPGDNEEDPNQEVQEIGSTGDADTDPMDDSQGAEEEYDIDEHGKKRKRGRPPISGDYVELAAKKQALNEQRKVEQELDRIERLKPLSSEKLYTRA